MIFRGGLPRRMGGGKPGERPGKRPSKRVVFQCSRCQIVHLVQTLSSGRPYVMKSPSYLPALFLGLCLCPFSGQPAYASPRAEQAVAPPSPTSSAEITFPGPLRSFLRMAAISQKASAEEVLPFLARNVVMIGYRRGKPTEYLLLLQSYLEQARELLPLAGPEGVIRVSSCREAQPLLAVLGYRLKQGCGSRTSVETADPERAFLTIDSGFPPCRSRRNTSQRETFCLSLFLHGPGALYAKRLDREREALRQQRLSGGSGVDRRSAGRSGLGSSLLGPVAHGSGNQALFASLSRVAGTTSFRSHS